MMDSFEFLSPFYHITSTNSISVSTEMYDYSMPSVLYSERDPTLFCNGTCSGESSTGNETRGFINISLSSNSGRCDTAHRCQLHNVTSLLRSREQAITRIHDQWLCKSLNVSEI